MLADSLPALAELTFAVLALIGAWVVTIFINDELLPRLSLWWDDIRQALAHYRMIRRERAFAQDAEGVIGQVHHAVEGAWERMSRLAERTQPVIGGIGDNLDEEV